jgi:hypothetical protein
MNIHTDAYNYICKLTELADDLVASIHQAQWVDGKKPNPVRPTLHMEKAIKNYKEFISCPTCGRRRDSCVK